MANVINRNPTSTLAGAGAGAPVNNNIPSWLQEHCTRLCANIHDFTNLNLNIRQLNPSMVEALSKALNENSTIQIINMTSSFSTGVNPNLSVLPFCQQVLPYHKSLQILHLSYNRLTNTIGPFIGMALTTNTQLQELYLDYNNLDCHSAIAIAKGIEQNTTLKVLKLNSNRIGDEGGKALGNALKINRSLKTLGLSRNTTNTNSTNNNASALGWETGKAFYEALLYHGNSTLTTLEIAEGNPQVPNGEMLEYLVRANKAGRYLINKDNTPLGIWPLVLARSTSLDEQPDMSFFFLRERPDLVGAAL